MAKVKNPNTLIRQLKKQIAVWRRKEKMARQQLKKAFGKIKVLGRSYEKKIAVHLKKMKAKIASAEVMAYIKAASEIERQVERKIAAKQKVVSRVVSHLEKEFAAKLAGMLEKKAKRVGKRRKVKGRVRKKK